MVLLRTALILFLGTGLACLVHAFYYYPQLPEVVASHFGTGGKPDAWSSRNIFVGVYIIAIVMNGLIFLGISYGVRSIPDSMISLPNRDFWLAVDRRRETYRFIFHYFLWYGTATFLLLLDVFHQSFMVHTGRVVSLTHPWLSIVLYLGFSFVWCGGLFVKFFRKPGVGRG